MHRHPPEVFVRWLLVSKLVSTCPSGACKPLPVRTETTGLRSDTVVSRHLGLGCYALQPGVERELLARGELRQDYIRGGPVEGSRTGYTFDDYGFG